jgi:hypothetical protein
MVVSPGAGFIICTRFYFRLVQTNQSFIEVMIKQIIKDNALTIRKYLADNGGSASLEEIQVALHMTDPDINRAIGWLAKEQSIFITRAGDSLIIALEFD